jgi:hypothetical protein
VVIYLLSDITASSLISTGFFFSFLFACQSAPAEDDDDDNEEEEARKRRQELYAGGGRRCVFTLMLDCDRWLI